MPTRRRTRAQDRAHRITRERAPNKIRLYLERKQEFRAWTTIKPDPHPSSDLRLFPITSTRITGMECGTGNRVRQLSDVRTRGEPAALRGGRPG